MTIAEEKRVDHGSDDHGHNEPRGIYQWLTSTDHKVIGKSYMYTSLVFLLIAGSMAMLIRIQLTGPNNHFISQQAYNELFTIHGSIMLYLFAGPFAFGGFANFILPLQIGAPDMAFPRLNALSYWLYLTGGTTMLLGFFTAGGAAAFGWVAYAPLSSYTNAPGVGPDLWIIAIALTGFSGIFTAVNLITTAFYLRAPGMTMFRLPIFTWNMIVTGMLILIAFPILTAAMIMLYADRHLGTHFFTVAGGGSPVMWQNLFWFFGHPEVYILALPYFGIVSEIIPVFSRKPVFGYKGLVFATLSIAALSTGVWAHHMFTTGTVLLPFFSALSLLIAVPTGIKVFTWLGTMWGGNIAFDTPMLWVIGFIVTFVMGGITGVMLASPPIDFAVHDTYFVVAHFHQVLAGTAVFAGFAGFYYWYPKLTGRMLRERLGKAQFWLAFIGFGLTFIPQYLIGLRGMPRRVPVYLVSDHVTFLNRVSTFGAAITFLSFVVWLVNLYVSWKKPVKASGNPWDGHTLEWATTSPPAHHNFTSIPPIRSQRPVWDANHPEYADYLESHDPKGSKSSERTKKQ
ncbi:cytochrome c oxidase subunit I [Acidithrix ferrooxidans]|uniref:Cytochrome c oxidase subunit 1 n=1 Tax=Acidithrix ferrooxidans TaxID=1280514 RepID=A0A0D8HJI1_9ACTN|nr:cytochrome c oxidase subunit I [Acidithrix ferrooxidans]KJF18019.1 cytochrome c oxidase subunit 1 [Acidithrix ferrooxidans]